MARCPICGHENTNTAKFCEDCGKNLDETMFIEKDTFIGITIDGR